MGNLRSVQKALEKAGAQAEITQSPEDILKADKVVLPGVGAIRPAMEKLRDLDMVPAIRETIAKNKPFLGICLGLQLLFERSDEGGMVEALGILPGTVDRFSSLKVPQMGWNSLKIRQAECSLFSGLKNDTYVYFCHSYFVNPAEKAVMATSTNYGVDFTSSICKGNLFGVQFHPEKSQAAGIKILENFVRL
jgi:glutamine amidotransferase